MIRPRPLPLIVDGVVLRRNLRREFITDDELMGQLRQQGIAAVTDVSRAHMESDGGFSFVLKKGSTGGEPPRPPSKQRV